MHPVDACPQARLNMKPAGVGIVFQREETLDHNGLVVRAVCALAPGLRMRVGSARLRDAWPNITRKSSVVTSRQVDSLAPGGPADCSKMVEPGDRLITINGKSIRGLDARSV